MTTVVHGERHATFVCMAGVPQGSPASATLFVLAMIPVLRLLERLAKDDSHTIEKDRGSHADIVRGLVRAYTDDIALVHASVRHCA